jgi:hypothetical protein
MLMLYVPNISRHYLLWTIRLTSAKGKYLDVLGEGPGKLIRYNEQVDNLEYDINHSLN